MNWAMAVADGHPILVADSGSIAILPLLRKTPYDPLKDLHGFIQLAKASGASWNFGSVGNGSMAHDSAE